MFFYNPNFYYITIGLQLLCVLHCIRKGKQNNWIWLIVFLPLVGCIAYIFTEIFTGRDLKEVQSGVTAVLVPSRHIKKLEENLRFSDTFNNRVMLADAYLDAGFTDKALDLYESSLAENFTENEYVLSKLIHACFLKKRYEEIIPIGKKIMGLPQFTRSRYHIMYALSLDYTGNQAEAEKEFSKMKAKFANYEARYEYGKFLARSNRENEAARLFADIIDEAPHLSPKERRYNRQWVEQAKVELKKQQV
jgi:hypothetical protein